MTGINPRRGEVWRVRFDPATGAEIGKDRPAVVINEQSAVVINDPAIGRLPLRIVVPITEWDPRFAQYPWFVQLAPTATNGLTKESGADAFQVKSVSLKRFLTNIGTLLDSQLDDISAAIAICVGAP
jgi:mRNA interferase MazF